MRKLARVQFACLLLTGAVWAQSFVPTPLNDLGTGKYKGFQGGLYEKGSNAVPLDHQSDGMALAGEVKPVRGKFVFLAIGMSNAAMEFATFVQMAGGDRRVNHDSMVVVNGAQGAMTGCAWTAVKESPQQHGCNMPRFLPNQYDRIRDDVLKPAGLAEDQVEVIWMKNADPRPSVALPSKDSEAYQYERYIGETARAVRSRYPNLKLMFLTSRIYAGYATVPLNPEPYAYEYGFAVQWAIQAQISQMRTATIDPVADNLDYKKNAAPWMAWGPYLWADGSIARSDGLTWDRSEFMPDGTHPNAKGREKVAHLLLDFFLNSPYTTWFKK